MLGATRTRRTPVVNNAPTSSSVLTGRGGITLRVNDIAERGASQRFVVYISRPAQPTVTEAAMTTVDVATVAKVASATVFGFCLLTLALFWISDFYILYPPLSLLFMAIAAALYAVTVVASKQG